MPSTSGGGSRLRALLTRLMYGDRPDPDDREFRDEAESLHKRIDDVARRQRNLSDRARVIEHK